MIRVFVTGGTFDKTYDEIEGTLAFDAGAADGVVELLERQARQRRAREREAGFGGELRHQQRRRDAMPYDVGQNHGQASVG